MSMLQLKKNPWSAPLSEFAPKSDVLFLVPCRILPPSCVKIRFLRNAADKPTDKSTNQ